jgi:hypothetical protein
LSEAPAPVSRLDSFIRRLEAQRACIDAAAKWVAELDGPAFELGLGNGRTYDHLRERLDGREIFVFERQLAAHPACIPDSEHLTLGDIHETLPAALARFEGRVALIHSDIGTGDEEANAAIASFLSGYLTKFLRPGGVIMADQPMTLTGVAALPLPEGVKPGRYFIYRRHP